jgi:hypothetical protein
VSFHIYDPNYVPPNDVRVKITYLMVKRKWKPADSPVLLCFPPSLQPASVAALFPRSSIPQDIFRVSKDLGSLIYCLLDVVWLSRVPHKLRAHSRFTETAFARAALPEHGPEESALVPSPTARSDEFRRCARTPAMEWRVQ